MADKKVFPPSPNQAAIYHAVTDENGDIRIRAVAGSGKTYTLKQIFKLIEQGKKAIYVAFNRDIVAELKPEAPAHIQVCTLHSFGLNEIRFKYGRNRDFEEFKDEAKTSRHILRHAENWSEFKPQPEDTEDDKRRREAEKKSYCTIIEKLIDMFRQSLPQSPEEVQMLIQKFDIPCYNGELERAKAVFLDVRKDFNTFDFTDMIYRPAVGDWRLKQYDFVFVDEAQDMNRAQQTVINKMIKPNGGRLIVVGDPKQAIYGFAGADSDSFENFSKIRPGIVDMPLDVCYRCSAAVIRHTQQIMANIQARPGADEGFVGIGSYKMVKPGDYVLCRNTRPLVSLCMKYISQGIKANIKGRDIGTNLINMVKGTGTKGIEPCFNKLDKDLGKLREKAQKQYPLRAPDEVPVVGNMIDKIEALRTIASTYKCKTTEDLNKVILEIFQEKSKDDTIVLSTIHKSKGLEADNIFIIEPQLMPAKWAKQEWELAQEGNLSYVARTRAKHNLYYIDDFVSDPEKMKEVKDAIENVLAYQKEN